MTVKVQHLRSSTASKRPTSAALLDGEVALNLSAGTAGAYFKDGSSNIIKLGPAEVGSTAPNASPGAGGSTGNTTGEFWYDTGNSLLKVYNGSSFAVAGGTTIGTTSIDLGSSSTTLAGLTDVSSAIFTFPGSTSGDFKLQSSAASDSTTYTWPAADGNADQVLATNGSGVLSWSEARTNDITQGDSSVVVTDTGADGNIAFTTDGTTAWNIGPSGHFIPNADSTFNIGASGTEVANLHAENIFGTLGTASQTNITGLGTVTTGTWNGDVVAAEFGGTGVDGSAASNGQLLIGNGTGYSLAAITQGEAISVTNGSGGITIAAEDAVAGAGSANKGVASFESSDFSVATGHVTLAATVAQSINTDGSAATPAGSAFGILGGTGLSTEGSGSDVTVTLDDTAVTAAGYGGADSVATFTVDAQGRLTAAADVSVNILHTQVSDFDTGVQTNTLDSLAAPVATVDMNSQLISGLADPVNDQDAATKLYVDSTAQGLDTKASVKAATTANLTATYANGTSGVGATLTNNGAQTAIVIDGDNLSVSDRVLIKNQTAAAENGIYVVTTVGDGSSNWVLTRSADMDAASEIPSAYCFVEGGNTNASNGYTCVTEAPVTVGTTAVTWEQFSGAGQIIAGDGLVKSGNTIDAVGTADRISVSANAIDIAASYVGQTTLTTLGTITTGTWNGDILGTLYGGTGADGTNVTASHVLMAPNGSAGNVSYREILTSDIAPVTGGSFDAGSY